MKKLILLLLISLTVSSCALRTRKMDIEQGNIITENKVSQLSIGMSQNQVKAIMGNPVLVQPFSNNQIDYIYTFQAGYSDMLQKRVTCIFYKGRLVRIVR